MKVRAYKRDTQGGISEEGKQRRLAAAHRGKETIRRKALERVLTLSTEELGADSRKKKVFLEQGEKCNKCEIVDWQGKKLTFELEHIDGNKLNNKRENLEVLCPNCHSQTLTWRGRNNKKVVCALSSVG